MPPPPLPDVIELNRITDRRGNLTFIEGPGEYIPFQIRRVYYLYDVPGGESRAGHAHRKCQTFVVAAIGSFDIVVDNGWERKVIPLNRSYFGVLIPTMVWRELVNFSSGSVCMALASEHFEETDYIRGYEDFLMAARSG